MSTTPEPTPEVENPDAEPDTQIEGDDADEEEEQEEQTPAQAAATEGSAELIKAAGTATHNYHKRLKQILGEDENRHECPTCEGKGVVWGDPPEEVPMIHPENLVECDKCNGYGQIITGSRAPDHITALCTTCAGNGFVTKPVVPENLYKLPEVPVITAEQAQHGYMTPQGQFVPYGSPPPTANAVYTP